MMEAVSGSQNGPPIATPASIFECSVCQSVAKCPVVTFCGHLHCWPCLHEKLKGGQKTLCSSCGVEVTIDKIVPVYGFAYQDDQKEDPTWTSTVPRRPSVKRQKLEEMGEEFEMDLSDPQSIDDFPRPIVFPLLRWLIPFHQDADEELIQRNVWAAELVMLAFGLWCYVC